MQQKKTSDIAIRVSNLSKCYQIYDNPHDRLKQLLYPRLQRTIGQAPKQYYRDFWALKDVSFEVNKGEAVGIIGRNGAGKSTLLQLICKTLSPTNGSVEVAGTVAALLELGSGFNPEFTGRENVYLNASLLGLSQEEVDKKFDEIAAFADIGNFLEQQTKFYSSGMLMRLAFAVNTCVDPEILIVDEALGVGDAPFQSKCFKRLRQLIDNGKSILFVSHDISTVRSICSRALWLKGGQSEMWGEAHKVAKEYEKFCWQEQGVVLQASEDQESKSSETLGVHVGRADISSSAPSVLFAPNPIFESNRQRSRMGTGAVTIENTILLNKTGQAVTSCDYNEHIKIYYLIKILEPVDSDFVLALRVRDLKGTFVYAVNDLKKIHRINGGAGDKFVAAMSINFPLHHQQYVISTAIFGFQSGNSHANGVYDYTQSVIWDAIDEAAYITVNPCKFMPLPGPVHVTSDLELEKI